MLVNKLILVMIVLFIGLQSQNLRSQDSNFKIRSLQEVNIENVADAYPWISDNGLTLYFCGQEDATSLSFIYKCQRKNLNSSFGSPTPLPLNTEGVDQLSPYLTKNQLKLVYSSRKPTGNALNSIYISERKHIHSQFKKAELLTLKGNVSGELISASITQDGQQLFVFNYLNGKSSILRFEKISTHTYVLSNRIVLKGNHFIKSGKLSSDGLKYFVSVESKGKQPSIYIMRRNSVAEKFQFMEVFRDDNINDPQLRNHQPYFSSNGKLLVFCRSEINDWTKNNIWIATLEETETQNAQPAIDLNIFPNPTSDYLNITSKNEQTFQVELFSVSGLKVIQGLRFNKQLKLNVNHIPSGNYFLRFTDTVNNQITSKKINIQRL